MFSKKLTALAAGALLVASTSAAAQMAPASAAPLAGAAMIQSADGEVDSTTTAIGVGFILIVAAILIATAGGSDRPDIETPGPPASP